MLYDVGISITYAYDRPAINGRNLLRLFPANLGERQRVIAARLVLEPSPDERIERTDFFGNRVVDAAWRSSHEETAFRLTARVQRNSEPERLDMSPDLARLGQEVADCRSVAAHSPHHFVGPSPRVRPMAEMTAFARSICKSSMTVHAAVDAVSLALHERMEFDPEATTVDTPPIDAFRRKKGVCQDFSHILIACLRGLGIPAAYVSGVLRTVPPEGRERLEGADAMHAWVSAWCGAEMGWVEFDPTNAIRAGTDHILIAWGRDYSDVAPVRGVLRSAGAQSSRQSVDVIPLTVRAP